jgi:hypothetical protein
LLRGTVGRRAGDVNDRALARGAGTAPASGSAGVSTDQSANRTQGETEGVEQEPTEAGEHDTTLRKQAEREGRPAGTGSAGSPSTEPNQGEGS